MKLKKTYTVDVDYRYGPIEFYRVEASSVAEARKKAKDRYAKDYFNKHYLKTFIYGEDKL